MKISILPTIVCRHRYLIPLAEQPRRRPAKPQRLVQFQHGIPFSFNDPFQFGSMMSSDKPAQAGQSGEFLQTRATCGHSCKPIPAGLFPVPIGNELCWKLECKGSRGRRFRLPLTVAPSTALTPNSDSEGTRAIRRFELCKQEPMGRTRGDGTASGRCRRTWPGVASEVLEFRVTPQEKHKRRVA